MLLDFIFDEAESALEIIGKLSKDKKPATKDWENLFASQGYRWLKAREVELKGDYSDSDFRRFILKQKTGDDYPGFKKTLKLIKGIDPEILNSMVFKYLPEDAIVDTRIVPLIKPEKNSFVYRKAGKLNILLYLNPGAGRGLLVNKLVHELYHVGFDSLYKPEQYTHLSRASRKTVEWLNAFGEGLAMLAAAGGIAKHPNQHDKNLQELWDRNIKNYNRDFKLIEEFLLKLLAGELREEREIFAEGLELMSNNGGQGSWYTVGWKMAVVIEERLGRERLLQAVADLPLFLLDYNRAAEEYNRKTNHVLPLWPEKLVRSLNN